MRAGEGGLQTLVVCYIGTKKSGFRISHTHITGEIIGLFKDLLLARHRNPFK